MPAIGSSWQPIKKTRGLVSKPTSELVIQEPNLSLAGLFLSLETIDLVFFCPRTAHIRENGGNESWWLVVPMEHILSDRNGGKSFDACGTFILNQKQKYNLPRNGKRLGRNGEKRGP